MAWLPHIPTGTPTIAKEITHESQTFIRIFSNGTVERPSQSPFIPAIRGDDPNARLISKDIIISLYPLIVARVYLPKPNEQDPIDKFPILVYFHGGAFLFESAFSEVYDTHFKTFVPQANAIVVSVEYRVAPENPIPACYHDCWHVLQWVSSHSPTSTESINMYFPWLINHGDFNRVFIGGDGAGANIAHNIAMRAGTEALPGGVKIMGAILSRPFFYSSYPVGSEPVIEPEDNIVYSVWNLVYPSAPGGIDNPVINPVSPDAPSLAMLGCSRIIVCVAGNDKFRDRGVWYYEAVKKSGWQGKLELFEEKGEDHIYHILYPESENAQKLIKRLVSFLLE